MQEVPGSLRAKAAPPWPQNGVVGSCRITLNASPGQRTHRTHLQKTGSVRHGAGHERRSKEEKTATSRRQAGRFFHVQLEGQTNERNQTTNFEPEFKGTPARENAQPGGSPKSTPKIIGSPNCALCNTVLATGDEFLTADSWASSALVPTTTHVRKRQACTVGSAGVHANTLESPKTVW